MKSVSYVPKDNTASATSPSSDTVIHSDEQGVHRHRSDDSFEDQIFNICICSLAVMQTFRAMAGRACSLHSAQVYCERWSHLHLKRMVPQEIRQTAASNIYRSGRKQKII